MEAPTYVSPNQLWQLGFRSLTIVSKNALENEEIAKLTENFKKMAKRDTAKSATPLNRQLGTTGVNADTRTPGTTHAYAQGSAGNTTWKQKSPPNKSSSESIQRQKNYLNSVIHKLYKNGEEPNRIAEYLDLPPSTVCNALFSDIL